MVDNQLLERIAEALERQCAQHDAQVQRFIETRDQNVARHEREREEELTAAREANAALLAKVDEIQADHKRLVALCQERGKP